MNSRVLKMRTVPGNGIRQASFEANLGLPAQQFLSPGTVEILAVNLAAGLTENLRFMAGLRGFEDLADQIQNGHWST
jgi:hypothetical protein